MTRPLALLAMLTASSASAFEIDFDSIIVIPATAANLQESCGYVVAPQLEPLDTYRSMDCALTIEGFFIEERTADLTTPENVRCGASLILAHANEDTLAEDILAAEFDKACGT